MLFRMLRLTSLSLFLVREGELPGLPPGLLRVPCLFPEVREGDRLGSVVTSLSAAVAVAAPSNLTGLGASTASVREEDTILAESFEAPP